MSDPTSKPIKPGRGEGDVFSEFSNQIWTPYTIRRMFVLLTRCHFSDSAHYGAWKEKFKNYTWSKDPKNCPLPIDYDYNYDQKNLDRLPAIFVGTDDFSYSSTISDNYKGSNEDNSGQEYVTIGSTNVILRHEAKTPDDTFVLSELSNQFFLGIRPAIQRQTRFRKYDVVMQKSSRPFERASTQADNKFISDLLINIQFNASWLSVQESHRVKTLCLNEFLAEYLHAPPLSV